MTPEKIAEVCHEVNKAYCDSIGDTTQKSWTGAELWQRHTTIKSVEHALAHPDATPENIREVRRADMMDNGWQYGNAGNPEAKQSPYTDSHAKFPVEQRINDYLLLAVVKALRSEVPAKA